jgi:hypothetical protein
MSTGMYRGRCTRSHTRQPHGVGETRQSLILSSKEWRAQADLNPRTRIRSPRGGAGNPLSELRFVRTCPPKCDDVQGGCCTRCCTSRLPKGPTSPRRRFRAGRRGKGGDAASTTTHRRIPRPGGNLSSSRFRSSLTTSDTEARRRPPAVWFLGASAERVSDPESALQRSKEAARIDTTVVAHAVNARVSRCVELLRMAERVMRDIGDHDQPSSLPRISPEQSCLRRRQRPLRTLATLKSYEERPIQRLHRVGSPLVRMIRPGLHGISEAGGTEHDIDRQRSPVQLAPDREHQGIEPVWAADNSEGPFVRFTEPRR